jgi:hypothetical protein
MSFFDVFKRSKQELAHEGAAFDKGLLIFENTSEVIQAERVLKTRGLEIRVMGPPPEIRSGCDLVIEIPIIEELDILRTLQREGVLPREVVPVTSPLLKPVDLFKAKELGQYLMVRAANMKLTIDRHTATIVNVSGGGCPDVPYLARELVGKPLMEAPSPREIGHTLCGYALQLAFEEATRLCTQ